MADLANIILEPEQNEILKTMISAQRSMEAARQKFVFVGRTSTSMSQIIHPGLDGGRMNIYEGHLHILAREELLYVTQPGNAPFYDVTPLGYKYFDEILNS